MSYSRLSEKIKSPSIFYRRPYSRPVFARVFRSESFSSRQMIHKTWSCFVYKPFMAASHRRIERRDKKVSRKMGLLIVTILLFLFYHSFFRYFVILFFGILWFFFSSHKTRIRKYCINNDGSFADLQKRFYICTLDSNLYPLGTIITEKCDRNATIYCHRI